MKVVYSKVMYRTVKNLIIIVLISGIYELIFKLNYSKFYVRRIT